MDFNKTDLIEGTLIITNEDGSITCIPQENCTIDEQALFDEFIAKYPNGKPILVSLEDTKGLKINEISSVCENKIVNEFYSSCLGERKLFDCSLIDQTNVIGLVAKAQMILAGIATDTTLDWKASGEPLCYSWTPAQVMTLGMDLFAHKTEKIKRYENLRAYIITLTTIEEINSVTWDTIIPVI